MPCDAPSTCVLGGLWERGAGGARRRQSASAMQPARTLLLLAALAALAAALPRAPRAPASAPALARARRQLADDDKLQPLDVEEGEEQTREKRKLEGVTQAGFGIKNAILGFVFGKINSLIDAKTRLIDTLDKQNIEKNKQYGIEAPQNGLASLGGVVSQVVGPKLQLLGAKIQAVSGLFGGSSGGGAGASSGGGGLGSHHLARDVTVGIV
ncbi:unnamed protein product [Plutella xylostella]|uniref:(diamondback moth) hypothetical protein n=1 Tax=Plutella xylostella TaxID=51655 RepID=A0A8S4G3S5_PLUXY|nr:unnamed protein product [Plutella xylostella]